MRGEILNNKLVDRLNNIASCGYSLLGVQRLAVLADKAALSPAVACWRRQLIMAINGSLAAGCC